MSRLQPFRGWRYAGVDLDSVLAPPYDVINPAQREAFAALHPANVVHFTLPQPQPDADRYAVAQRFFADWQHTGIVAQSDQPAVYLLRQRFQLSDGQTLDRLGFIARLRLARWGDGILPHERTFPQAKADRLSLLQASGIQDNPIFALFRDPDGDIRQQLAHAQSRPADAAYTDGDGVRHELWEWAGTPAAQLCDALEASTFYIADGHHRYETSLNYQAWRREHAGATDGDQPYDFTMTYFTAMEDAGTIILPTHRIVKQAGALHGEPLLRALADDFALDVMPDDDALIAELGAQPAGAPVFGFVAAGMPAHLLHLRQPPDRYPRLWDAYPPSVAELPVAILQALVLGPYFGISDDPQQQKAQLQFEPDPARSIELVRTGEAHAALLTTATSMAQLRAVADSGNVSPPKATYFYPKLPSGLVFNPVG